MSASRWFPGGALEANRLTGLITTLSKQVPQLDITIDRHDLRDELEKHFVEYTHYCLFADVYDSLLEAGEPHLNGNQVTLWPEEDALAKFRANIRRGHGKLARATGFTEGGYCTLYSEGAKLKGRPGVDGRIAKACQKVFDDEFGHMMYGVVGLEINDMTAGDWAELIDVTCQILRLRLYMRNAQFSHPLSDQRINEIIRRQDRADRLRLCARRDLHEPRARRGGSLAPKSAVIARSDSDEAISGKHRT